jgi:hypothetical protein
VEAAVDRVHHIPIELNNDPTVPLEVLPETTYGFKDDGIKIWE